MALEQFNIKPLFGKSKYFSSFELDQWYYGAILTCGLFSTEQRAPDNTIVNYKVKKKTTAVRL